VSQAASTSALGPKLARPSLGRNFWLLFTGQTVSSVGSQLTIVALPLFAISELHASNLAVGLLTSVGFLPYALFGLHAGAIADRLDMRTLMVVSDLGRAALLALVPLLWAFDRISMATLIAVMFAVGILTVFFEVCYSAYLPEVVTREQLVAGNTHLQLSQSSAQVAGPTLAGSLIEVFSAAAAIAVDAVTFVVSALFLGPLPRVERPPIPTARPPLRHDIREGLAFVLRHPVLRPVLATFSASVLFITMYQAVLVVFLRRGLGLSAGQLGALLAVGNAGFLVGALANRWLAKKLRLGQSFLLGLALLGTGFVVVGSSPHAHGVALVQVAVGQLIASTGTPITTVAMVTLRQCSAPPAMQARVNSVFRVLGRGTMPAGAALGGLIAQVATPRTALLAAGVGGVAAVVPAGRQLWRWTATTPGADGDA